jgi:Ca2+-binding RTX toxin-like protein
MATFNGTTLTGDNFVGSIEVDTVTYADSTNTEGVDASLAAGGSTGDAAGDHYSSIENLTGSTFDDALVGDDGGNVLTGLSGADSIFGQGGDDTIDGGSGKDTLDGGSGNDTITFDGSDFSIAGGTGTDTLMVTGAATINLSAADQSTGDTASVTGFENVDASGSSVAVSLTGDSGNNKLTGSNYAETLTGGQGADTLDGGGGDDTFTIASGEFVSGDSIQGGADSDKINVTATTANFTVGSISGVETLTTQGSDQTVTMTATQWAGFVNQIDLGSGTDLLKVLVSGASGNDISLIPVTATYTNIETVNLIGTANGATTNDTLKLTAPSSTRSSAAPPQTRSISATVPIRLRSPRHRPCSTRWQRRMGRSRASRRSPSPARHLT